MPKHGGAWAGSGRKDSPAFLARATISSPILGWRLQLPQLQRLRIQLYRRLQCSLLQWSNLLKSRHHPKRNGSVRCASKR